MPVAIVTDSTAALPRALADELEIGIVPLTVTVDGHPLTDGEVPIEELLSHDQVTTSAPPPGGFAQAVQAKLDAGADQVLVVTLSSTLSSTYQSAVVGAGGFGDSVRVLDSKTAAGALALAVRMAVGAGDLDEATARVDRVAREARLVGALSGLEQLAKSGRVPGLAARAGDALGIRPLFEIRYGEIKRMLPARNDKGAHDRILQEWRKTRSADAHLHVVALHSGAPERAESLLAAVTAEVEPATSLVSAFGPDMVANAGLGVSGLAWWWETER